MIGTSRSVVYGQSKRRGGGGGAYTANAVRFDGTNDYLTRGGNFTGAANGPAFTISFWVKVLGNDDVLWQFMFAGGFEPQFSKRPTNEIGFFLYSPLGVIVWAPVTVRQFTVAGNPGWHHVLVSANLVATPVGHFFIDDAAETITESTAPTTSDIDFTNGAWTVGARDDGSFKIDAEFADLWFDLNFLDISSESNRRKFIDASGKPVDLGSDGSTPTGSAPLLFLSGPTVDWHTNKGTGEGLTEVGALTDAASSPSD